MAGMRTPKSDRLIGMNATTAKKVQHSFLQRSRNPKAAGQNGISVSSCLKGLSSSEG